MSTARPTIDCSSLKELIREAMEFHLEGMKLHGEVAPEPTTTTEYVEVAAG